MGWSQIGKKLLMVKLYMLSISRKTSITCTNGVRIGSYCSTELNANACTLNTATRTTTILCEMYI